MNVVKDGYLSLLVAVRLTIDIQFGFVRGIEQAAGKAAGAADALLFRKHDASGNQPRASPPCHHGAKPT